MSATPELAMLAGVLADAGLKATLPLASAWGLSRALRVGSAAQRHVVWALGLGTLPLLIGQAWGSASSLALDVPWVPVVWGLGVMGALVPPVRGLLQLVWLQRGARRDPEHTDVWRVDHAVGPLTWGFFRPRIVLPAESVAWPASELEAVLAHERAHIERADWAIHLLVWGVCALFWFHPGVWWARRALVQEAEQAADDRVLGTGVRASDYAALLLRHARPHAPGLALGSSVVGARVRAVLDTRSRSPRRWTVAGPTLFVLLLLLPGLGAWSLWTSPPEVVGCRVEVFP